MISSLHKLAMAAALATFGLVASAQTTTDHAEHAMSAASGATMPMMGDSAAMDDKHKAMHEMHEKMMAAKTPEERKALMQEHMKAMHGDMAGMDGEVCDMAGMHKKMKAKKAHKGHHHHAHTAHHGASAASAAKP